MKAMISSFPTLPAPGSHSHEAVQRLLKRHCSLAPVQLGWLYLSLCGAGPQDPFGTCGLQSFCIIFDGCGLTCRKLCNNKPIQSVIEAKKK